VSNPKASIPFTYCEIFPGKIAIKNSAVAIPTSRRLFSEASDNPRSISTTPDANTTKSAESGTQLGTWAWNSRRLDVRCEMPA